jgi:DNA-binding CsgD family transcriptional regulator/ArsR family metal-binding transcriptional regulator
MNAIENEAVVIELFKDVLYIHRIYWEVSVINKGFLDFSLSKTGVTTTRFWGAYFKLKSDIRSIFPYINTSIVDARFYDHPEYMQLYFMGIKCTLYPDELIAASFTSKQAALAFFEQFMDYIDDLYYQRDSIQPDYRKYCPPSFIDILKLLPKSNCKKCGYDTCMAFAAAMRNGETKPDHCVGFAAPINIRKIYPIFDDKGDLTSTVAIDFDMPEEPMPVSPQNCVASPDYESIGSGDLGNKLDNDSAIDHASYSNTTANFLDSDETMGNPPLTQREIQVLKYLTSGSTNPEIAKILRISPHTVKSHVVHIFNKLGVSDRTQAAVRATRYHLKDEN